MRLPYCLSLDWFANRTDTEGGGFGSNESVSTVDAGFIDTEVIQYQDTRLYGVVVRMLNDRNETSQLVNAINSQKIFDAFVKEMK